MELDLDKVLYNHPNITFGYGDKIEMMLLKRYPFLNIISNKLSSYNTVYKGIPVYDKERESYVLIYFNIFSIDKFPYLFFNKLLDYIGLEFHFLKGVGFHHKYAGVHQGMFYVGVDERKLLKNKLDYHTNLQNLINLIRSEEKENRVLALELLNGCLDLININCL